MSPKVVGWISSPTRQSAWVGIEKELSKAGFVGWSDVLDNGSVSHLVVAVDWHIWIAPVRAGWGFEVKTCSTVHRSPLKIVGVDKST